MHEPADIELLRQYAEQHSETAFAALVTRHVDMVYSVALRKTGNAHAAEEVTQAVYIILARKAGQLLRHTVLTGWLYQAARLTASNFLRGEIRRAHREQEAVMQSIPDETTPPLWPQIAPLLEDAMGRLGQKERDALALRFFEGKSFAEIASEVGATENAAKKRVAHALEKLRDFFHRHGVKSSAEDISHTISSHSIQPAPALLAKTVTTIALAKGATVSTTTATLIKGALKIMAWTKAKTAVVAIAAVVLATGTTTVTVQKVHERNLDAKWDLGRADSRILNKAPHIVRIIPTKFPRGAGWVGSNDRRLGIAIGLKEIIQGAYNHYDPRVIYLTSVPPGEYDFIANLPRNNIQAMKQEIQKQFGLIGRTATIETNVLFLKVRQPDAVGLVKTKTHDSSTSSSSQNGEIRLNNVTPGSVGGAAENEFGIPVVDQTDSKGRYDIDLKWDDKNDTDHQNFKQVLLDQLGLELVPGTAPVEFLIVEKAK